MLLPFSLGLYAGALHALTGPDHVAGVAPIAARAGRRAVLTGVAWGLGHAGGAGAAALLGLALAPAIHAAVAPAAEVAVGAFLILIGALGLRDWRRRGAARAPGPRAPATAFALGCLHGTAGLPHLASALPTLALPGAGTLAAYLGGYALASTAAITAITAGLGAFAHGEHTRRGAIAVTSAASIAVGVCWLALP